MKANTTFLLLLTLLAQATWAGDRNDPRLRVEPYSPSVVTTLYAKRGVTTHIQLEEGEKIEYVSTGVGADCKQEQDTWCVLAPAKGTQIFVKPKASATGSNNIAIATNIRAYSLRFVMVADDDPREPVFRLTYSYQQKNNSKPDEVAMAVPAAPIQIPTEIPPPVLTVKERFAETPTVRNSSYSMKVGKHSEDIAPVLVFDDGRFTYFKYPNNREVPALFQVGEDGQESVVNVHMEIDPTTGLKDLLCADRVAKQFYLRRGKAVVGVWNDEFDLDGVPPNRGTTVAGVERVLRSEDLR